MFIFIVGVFGAIKCEANEISGVDGVSDLILDTCLKIILGIFEASGVYQDKTIINARHDIIASCAFFAGDNGDIFMRETIEQAGFASIRLANKGDNRKLFHRIIISY